MCKKTIRGCPGEVFHPNPKNFKFNSNPKVFGFQEKERNLSVSDCAVPLQTLRSE